MTKNRKKSDTYRFNGVWGIEPNETAKLKILIEQFEAKLADPEDRDDKKWTARWLKRFQQELEKKEKAIGQRQSDSVKHLRKMQAVTEVIAIEWDCFAANCSPDAE